MSYIGNEPRFTQFPSKYFNGDGTAMTVSLDYAPPNKAALLVFISGVRQDTDAYTLSGTSLTFTGSVPSGTNNVQVVHLGLTVQVPAPADDTITTAKIQDEAVTNAKLANMAANTIKVRDANSSGVPSDKALATTEILIGDGTGFTAAALSGDATMTNAGAVTIADNAVSLAKMAGLVRGKIIYGDASGDPAALTVGGADEVLTSDGTDISWAAASGTTINNNADNRVITGSGTANTLEGEADLTYNGADLVVNTSDLFVDGSENGVAINGSSMGSYATLDVNGTLRAGYGDGTEDGLTGYGSGHFWGAKKNTWTADSSTREVFDLWTEQALIMFSGNKPGDLVRFCDLLLLNATHTAPVLVATSQYGSNPTRTYSNSGDNLKVVFDDSGATWNMLLTGMGGTQATRSTTFSTMGDT